MLLADVVPWATQGGAVVGIAWMLFTARLIPRRLHDQAISAERQRGDDWRDAYRLIEARSEIQDRQLGEILAALRAPREAA